MKCRVRSGWERGKQVLPGALPGLWLCSNLPLLLLASLEPQAFKRGQGIALPEPVRVLGSPSLAQRERSLWGKSIQREDLKQRLNVKVAPGRD